MNQIIYSDVLNQTELLRTLAKQNQNKLGVRVLNTYDLVLLIYSKLCLTKDGDYLSNEEQDFIYFALLNPSCFGDAVNVKNAINSFRDTGKGNTPNELEAFLSDDFKEKKTYILDAFKKYNEYKANNKLYDLYDLLYELKDKAKPLNMELTYFDDLPYSSLAIQVFNLFFNVKEERFEDLLKKEKHEVDIVKCYGKNNEFEYVLNTIYKNSIPIDKCLIVLTNKADSSFLVNRFIEHNLMFTTSLGVSFSHTNVGQFVNELYKMKLNNFGVDSYKELFASSFFNKSNYIPDTFNEYYLGDLLKYLGFLKQGFDSDEIIIDESLYQSDRRSPQTTHGICEILQKIVNDINKNQLITSFIEKNVVVDEYHFEALELLKKYSEYCKKYDIPLDTIIDKLFNASIGQHISSPGAIHICSLQQAFSSLRDHVFIMELDSAFPGNPKENYLIYDEEYLSMGADKYVSTEIVKEKERLMNLLINLSNHAYLSYSYFSNIDNKSVNPSSIIFNINSVFIPEFSYVNDALINNADLIRDFNNGILSAPSINRALLTYDPKKILNKTFSPSSFLNFFIEEKRLDFLLSVILGLSIDEEEDTHEVISAADRGTLFHKAVENFNKSKWASEDDFVKHGLKLFDDFLKIKPPVIAEEAKKERDYFENGLRNHFKGDPGNQCVKSEYTIKDTNVFGIKFKKGTFDRLEKDSLGRYILVDYKTGNTPHHKSGDVVSCMQGLIYAYMIEQEPNLGNIKVDEIQFRYPFISKDAKPSISYNQTNKDELENKINEFINSINNHDFNFESSIQKYVDKYAHLISLMKELKK